MRPLIVSVHAALRDLVMIRSNRSTTKNTWIEWELDPASKRSNRIGQPLELGQLDAIGQLARFLAANPEAQLQSFSFGETILDDVASHEISIALSARENVIHRLHGPTDQMVLAASLLLMWSDGQGRTVDDLEKFRDLPVGLSKRYPSLKELSIRFVFGADYFLKWALLFVFGEAKPNSSSLEWADPLDLATFIAVTQLWYENSGSAKKAIEVFAWENELAE